MWGVCVCGVHTLRSVDLKLKPVRLRILGLVSCDNSNADRLTVEYHEFNHDKTGVGVIGNASVRITSISIQSDTRTTVIHATAAECDSFA